MCSQPSGDRYCNNASSTVWPYELSGFQGPRTNSETVSLTRGGVAMDQHVTSFETLSLTQGGVWHGTNDVRGARYETASLARPEHACLGEARCARGEVGTISGLFTRVPRFFFELFHYRALAS